MTAPQQGNLFEPAPHGEPGQLVPAARLDVVFDAAEGCVLFICSREGQREAIARGVLRPGNLAILFWSQLEFSLEVAGKLERDHCGQHGSSVRALLNRFRRRLPVPAEAVQVSLLLDRDHGQIKAGQPYAVPFPASGEAWSWIARQIGAFARLLSQRRDWESKPVEERGRLALRQVLESCLAPQVVAGPEGEPEAPAAQRSGVKLQLTLDFVRGEIQLLWEEPGGGKHPQATGRISCTGLNELTWEWASKGAPETVRSTHHRNAIRAQLQRWRRRCPVSDTAIRVRFIQPGARPARPMVVDDPPAWAEEGPWTWIEEQVTRMASDLRLGFSALGKPLRDLDPETFVALQREDRWLAKRERKLAEAQARLREGMRRAAEKRRERRASTDAPRMGRAAPQAADGLPSPAPTAGLRPTAVLVPVRLESAGLALQDTALALTDLRGYFLREEAARWWVSNQTDDLLGLPFCRVQHLEYQLRTALRVIGPLRGRALLSDEVGLGKTIEAGLVLKEYLTRGLVRRFLVLTVPSLVDQWAEELEEKFRLTVATSNDPGLRADPEAFWTAHHAVVASLHTVKQPAQLALAQRAKWDLLIVDEAHYLRNRNSQAWQAVSSLPRQFLLLLTATPVQNSLEELYNLVTLLQPGHLPSPKEFRARFVDPKRPHRPRAPEELRRLLWQVMIRNTRANAGLGLPSRRAETVVFEPTDAEAAYQIEWEREFREALTRLPTRQASLWGRLVLQAAGSSPAAWRRMLERYPDEAAARRWREGHALNESWERQCAVLPPLAGSEGGVVIFTQFLETQAALAGRLAASGVPTHVINGQTPPPQRQPITEAFHRQGGALLLTHSGTEGRNLQFCHRLINFDLPWNPMEIEQRIGRLHRIGQERTVHIYNLVQAGTLQEQLLQVLQEKLNLFELVVGEAGLVLGERFGSDEFAGEVFRRWQENEGHVPEAMQALGNELAAARQAYDEVKQLDETLFAQDYETL